MDKITQAGQLSQRVEVLVFQETAPGVWRWVREVLSWAMIVPDDRKTIFASVAMGLPGVRLIMRQTPRLQPGRMLLHRGQHLYLTEVHPAECSGYMALRAAVVRPSECRAEPQQRTGRDAFNRPVAVAQAAVTFPGLLAEPYQRSEAEDLYRRQTQQRVLVTPVEIALRAGDLVRVGRGGPYTVRTVLDLDPHQMVYEIEREEDV